MHASPDYLALDVATPILLYDRVFDMEQTKDLEKHLLGQLEEQIFTLIETVVHIIEAML